jgi:hypothetical protein
VEQWQRGLALLEGIEWCEKGALFAVRAPRGALEAAGEIERTTMDLLQTIFVNKVARPVKLLEDVEQRVKLIR